LARICGLLASTAAVGGYACGARRTEDRLAREMASFTRCDAPGREDLPCEVQRT